MSVPSPTLEGFRAAFRCPSVTFAEIAWRWTVGAVASALFLFSLFEFLNTLPVTHGDATLLGTGQPLLVGKAISHIFHGSLNRAVFATLLGCLALVLLWIIAASIGRAATVRALLDYFRNSFRRDVARNVSASAPPTAVVEGDADTVVPGTANGTALEYTTSVSPDFSDSIPLRSLAVLNFLRVAVSLAAILAFIGAATLAGFASPAANPRPGLAFILFLPFAALICIVWPALNWLLSLASIFVVRDAENAADALSTAVTFFREHVGSVLAVSTWTGVAHLVALSIAGTAVSLPLAFIQFVPPRLVIAVVILLTLAYFAIVDWLYIARLAGYLCIAEMPDAPPVLAPLPAPPSMSQSPPHSAVDRDEPILSDLQPLIANAPS
ncbi:MAG: hypothetical protein JWQ87_1396 [Candidatus Sulfotelmatobacter sp.]|nr:hypothetical protein [Candidatus Sulfotelmatobacter sp.]